MLKVSRATAELTATAMMGALKEWVVRTNTADNGKEFEHHHKVSEALSCKCYFARPYHSWERGTNEQIQAVEDKLNNRLRKRHGFKSPLEVLKRCKCQVGVATVS